MKNIVQIVQHLKPGGIETLTLDLHEYYQKQGHNSFIISLEGDKNTGIDHWPRLRPYKEQLIFMQKEAKFRLSFVNKLGRKLAQLNAQVVHSHHIGPLLFCSLASLIHKPLVHIHTEHDAWHLNKPKHCFLQRTILALSKPIIISDSETVAQAFRDKIPRTRIKVIKNGINTDRFKMGNRQVARKTFNLPSQQKIIGCSGRLEAVKGQKNLISALVNLPDEYHIALAGIGSEEENLKQMTKALGLTDRVHFLGRIDDMPSFYQSLDLFCLPSYNEGMPLSSLEAQACGIQTIVTDVGGSKETLCPDTGTLISAGSANDITEAVLNQSKNKPYNISPRHFIKNHCNLKMMADEYETLHLNTL